MLAGTLVTHGAAAQQIGTTGTVTGADGITYTYIVAKDTNMWLQQNLGSAQVATSDADTLSYGDLYQWGRWDDGHQSRNPDNIHNGTPTPNDPTGTGSVTGNPFYYHGWWAGGSDTDKWSAASVADITAFNGCDPCKKILGGDWHVPNNLEWREVRTKEGISDINSAFASGLKIAGAGRRNGSAGYNGALEQVDNAAYFWSSDVCPQSEPSAYIARASGNSASFGIACSPRGHGLSIRCIKTPTTSVKASGIPQIRLYPNPVADELFIQTGTEKMLKIIVFDVSGKVMMSAIPDSEKHVMSLKMLVPGMYYIRVQTVNGMAVQKLVKE